MRLSIASVASVAACVLALVAAGAAGSHSNAARCTTAGLNIWISGGEGAAGSIYRTLDFTNQSKSACTLAGYPGVSAVNRAGRQLGRPASRTPSPIRAVTLRPGYTATAELRIVQVLNFPRAICQPAAAAGLRVYPPGQTASKVVLTPFRACSRSGPVFLSVKAVA